MSYVERSIAKNEHLVARAKLHWIIFARAITIAFFATVILSFAPALGASPRPVLLVATLLFLAAAAAAIPPLWHRLTTELQ